MSGSITSAAISEADFYVYRRAVQGTPVILSIYVDVLSPFHN